MRPIRLHPRVYDDIDEALASTREQFGPRQVVLYARLISKGRQTLRRHPTIGQLREDLGPGIRVYCIAAGRINAPHGYIYRVHEDGTIYVARLVHLAGTCLTSQIGGSEQRHRGDANCEVAAARTVASRGSTLSTQKRGVSFR